LRPYSRSAALAQQVPAAVELDVELAEPLALGIRHGALRVEPLLLGHQMLDVLEHGLVARMQGHGVLLRTAGLTQRIEILAARF